MIAEVSRAAAELVDPPVDPQAWRDAAVLAALDGAARRRDDALVLDLAVGYDPLLTWLPVRSGNGQVTLEPGDNAERRRRGSFATPPSLAAVLARHALPGLPDGRPTVVDPACGTGALLAAALERLVELGVPAADALGLLHGVDTDPVAVALCRARLLAGARRLDPQLDSRIDVGAAAASLQAQVLTGDALIGPGAIGGPDPSGEGDLFTESDLFGGSDILSGSGLEDRPDSREGQATPDAVTWHQAFPQVLAVPDQPAEPVTGWRGGFAAVVANPPWERLKVFRREGRDSDPALAALRRRRLDASRSLRDGGRHPLTGSGELNAYLPFVETCWRLLAADGRAGLLVPAGIAADRSSAALMAALLETGALAAVHLLATDRAVIEGVSPRLGIAVLALRSGAPRPGRRVAPSEELSEVQSTETGAQVAVGVTDPADPDPARCWRLTPDLPRLVNPNTATLPLCGSSRDAELLAAAHRRWPILRRRRAGGEEPSDNPWQARLVTPLHMTNDAVHFRTTPDLDGADPDGALLPLWEAKHAGLLDPRGGGRAGHRYWVPAQLVRRRLGALADRGWLAGYRNVTTVDAPRTLLPSPLPLVGVGNSFPLIDAPRLPLLLAALASLPVDYLVRQKHAGANLNFFKLEQAAVPHPSCYDRPAPWQPELSLESWVLRRFAAAVPWADDLAPLAAELTGLGVDTTAETASRSRERALAELDAAHAVLLGLTRDDLAHVLATFGALAERERREHGRFVTADRVMQAFDQLT